MEYHSIGGCPVQRESDGHEWSGEVIGMSLSLFFFVVLRGWGNVC